MTKTKLAILGLGSRSTLHYLKELNKLYHLEKGDYSTCQFTLLNTNFNAINQLLPNTSVALDAILQNYINEIEQFDIEEILVPNITLHETIDRLNIQKTILHPLALTLAKIQENKTKEIVLFGSKYSMQANYIRSYFESNQIAIILPNQEEMLLIDEVRKQIYNKTETTELINKYFSIIDKYSKNNLIVLACTELSILKPTNQTNIIDMAQLQIEAAIKNMG